MDRVHTDIDRPLAEAVAARVLADPVRARVVGRRNLAVMRASGAGEPAMRWLARWEALLGGPLEELLGALEDGSPEGRSLRQCSPFAGLLTPSQRWGVIRAARAADRAS